MSPDNDLLTAEAQLRDRQMGLHLARLDVVRGWVRLWLARGEHIPEAVYSVAVQ